MAKKNLPVILGTVIIVISLIVGGAILVINHSQNQIKTRTEGEFPENTAIDNSNEITPQEIDSPVDNPESDNTATTNRYKDGTYSAFGSYVSPAGTETIQVQVILTNDVISSVKVTPQANDFESQRYQQRFSSGISSVVVGKPLDQAYINGRVNGSSLTGEGFNKALNSIRKEAQGG